MTDQSPLWKVKIQGPAQRALAEHLPVGIATAALEFIQHVLPTNPYRVGGELSADMRDSIPLTLASTGSCIRSMPGSG